VPPGGDILTEVPEELVGGGATVHQCIGHDRRVVTH